MQKRYAVVFGRLAGVTWHEQTVRAFGSVERAERWAVRWGDRRPELATTRPLFHYDSARRSLTVVDRKTGGEVWQYELQVVPSVGELGRW